MSHYNDSSLPLTGYSFDCEHKTPKVERSTALALRNAFEDLLTAKKDLKKAMSEVPDYTGQWDDEDYYRNEAETLSAASNAFEDAVRASVAAI